MGYPMTYQRVINRNRLQDGAYDQEPVDWYAAPPKTAWSLLEDKEPAYLIEHGKRLEQYHNEAAERWNDRIRGLVGDLRRLEADAVDEEAICSYVADRTGVDAETVAAVLKEFMAW